MPSTRHLLLLLVGLLPWTAAAEPVALSTTPHLDTLPIEAQVAAGLPELTLTERQSLEAFLAYEIAAARAGNVSGFARTFSTRRTPEELAATGLDRRTADQRAAFDTQVAARLAERPAIPFVTRRQRGADATPIDHVGTPPWRVHGSVTATVGTSSAGTFYGGSLTTAVTDPTGRFTAQITYGTLRGALPYLEPYSVRPYPYVWAPPEP
jgi:hypothetical protein